MDDGGAYTTTIGQGEGTRLLGVSNLGQYIGQYGDFSGLPHSFIGGPAGPSAEINDPLSLSHYYNGTYPGQYSTFVTGINDANDVVGYYYNDSGYYGFLHTGNDFTTGYVTLSDPNSHEIPPSVGGPSGTVATGVNDLGEIIGTYYDGNGVSHGFVHIGSDYTTGHTTIDYGSNTQLIAINNNGQILGVSSQGYFVDSNGTFIQVQGLPGTPTGINDSDEIVGSYSQTYGFAHAFLASLVYPPPQIVSAQLTGTVQEQHLVTGSSAFDYAININGTRGGVITFTDASLSTTMATVLSGTETVVYTDAHGNVDTSQLTAAQIQAFEQAFELSLTTNATQGTPATQGTINWTYSIPDKVLDFLGVGER